MDNNNSNANNNKFKLDDVNRIYRAVGYTLHEYAKNRKGRIHLAKETGMDISLVFKYNKRVLEISNMRTSNFMAVFKFYIEHLQDEFLV